VLLRWRPRPGRSLSAAPCLPPPHLPAGGRDQFNWDNVKSDKDREFYLGHSVKAATGRWQKGARRRAAGAPGPHARAHAMPRAAAALCCRLPRASARRAGVCAPAPPRPTQPRPAPPRAPAAGKDLFWYTREKQDEARVEQELAAVKAREQELMMEVGGRLGGGWVLVVEGAVDRLSGKSPSGAGCFVAAVKRLWRQQQHGTSSPPCALLRLLQALGLKPKTQRSTMESQLDQQELNRLLQRGGDGEEPAGGSGLGFAAWVALLPVPAVCSLLRAPVHLAAVPCTGGAAGRCASSSCSRAAEQPKHLHGQPGSRPRPLRACCRGKGAAAMGGPVHEVMGGEGLAPPQGLPPPPPGGPGGSGAPKRSAAELEEQIRLQEKAAKRARKEAKKVGSGWRCRVGWGCMGAAGGRCPCERRWLPAVPAGARRLAGRPGALVSEAETVRTGVRTAAA
jgi:hypothetical protein